MKSIISKRVHYAILYNAIDYIYIFSREDNYVGFIVYS